MHNSFLHILERTIQYIKLPFKFPHLAYHIIRWIFTQRSAVSELARLMEFENWYRARGFKTIIDVGANIGAFCFAMRALMPEAEVYAFEPIPECFEKLEKNLGLFGKFHAFQTAVGNKDGITEFHHHNFNASSSILPMSQKHKQVFPGSAKSKIINVPITKLDNYCDQINLEPPILLKIDVQGFEDQVIRGAKKILQKVDWILTEVSYVPLYNQQPLFSDIFHLLNTNGFLFFGNQDVLLDSKTGDILQSDALFKKEMGK